MTRRLATMRNYTLILLAALASFGGSLVFLFLLLVSVPSTETELNREDFVKILETSSYAADSVAAKANALVLFNGYQGSQFLLKLAAGLAAGLVVLSGINILAAWRLARSSRNEPNWATAGKV